MNHAIWSQCTTEDRKGETGILTVPHCSCLRHLRVCCHACGPCLAHILLEIRLDLVLN